MKPKKCVSKRLLPILSPPGEGIRPFLKRANVGPNNITEPLRAAAFFL